MPETDKYEAVIGLEVHTQLLTKSKLFCGDSAEFGNPPNTNVSAISLAHPGTLPKMNEKAVELAIKLGLAFNSDIVRDNYFARKNYFYPDLPKGYQVSQHTTPICKNGNVTISIGEKERKIILNRIHLEEDAGKSIHDVDENFTCIDLNRAGVPLLEIVSEPDLHSSEEAFAYVTEIRKMVRHLDICDGNMEEGSMRCDANVSVRLKGDTELGTKVEVKNLNSIRNVKKAIDFEIKRLIDLLESGKPVVQETRSFDASQGTTFSLRTKEEANDYRYFPEPDLAPFQISEEQILSIRESMPELPLALEKRLIREYSLSTEAAKIISADKNMAAWFDRIIGHTKNYKAVSNWIIGPVKSFLNENNSEIETFPISSESMAALVDLVEEGRVSFGIACSRIFPVLLNSGEKEPFTVAKELNLLQEKNGDTLQQWIDDVLSSMPDKVLEYKKGKKNLTGLFAGEVKKKSRGKADMKAVIELLNQKLNQ
ncbi:Asp-tRNA(Asn)/Glu-tRNA(Gln) amidotransferase subunit GatB [Hanamia caeni]|jgi:aspartyl-tRNA(Asn)/glutamyl-tRNA(Gln) amidotransferase subunit B|uniref:Aspartyl/glutamyl-tRNA(Asn/Gln) amidotransferase subunit B n=2 Tax=Hanamia caeni TaxID=2294116 RepID=A0A3M9NC70_9BACT|nr:Asp-tRNA(Asn)/Glu-tRNA(Gln) amidotransferase subunit GatB [Hanamia caeni]